MNEAEMELQMAGYQKKYDYSQYAHDNNVNVIPEQSFKQLITDTFKTISDVLAMEQHHVFLSQIRYLLI